MTMMMTTTGVFVEVGVNDDLTVLGGLITDDDLTDDDLTDDNLGVDHHMDDGLDTEMMIPMEIGMIKNTKNGNNLHINSINVIQSH